MWLTATAASMMVMTGLAAPALADETQTYTYDALQRLISVKYSGTINAGQAHSICYDPAGNRSRYRSSSTGVVATCAVAGAATSGGDGLLEPEFLSVEGSSSEDIPAEDVYPPSEAPAGEAPLPDVPPVEASGPQGGGAQLPPDPPSGFDNPPVDPSPDGEGSGR